MAQQLESLLEQAELNREAQSDMKDIPGFEGIYAVTRDGRVWSYRKNIFLSPYDNGRGYLKVDLYRKGKRFKKYIHRLVAEAFILNPENLPQINHKSENKADNRVDNLEWCNSLYNNNYGTKNERTAKALSKAVLCVETGVVYPS
jgi:hypothetical protein